VRAGGAEVLMDADGSANRLPLERLLGAHKRALRKETVTGA
jgi:hypothetical protein